MRFGEPRHNKEKNKKTKTGTRCGSPNRLPGPAQQGSGGWRVARDSAAGTGLIFFFYFIKVIYVYFRQNKASMSNHKK